MSNHDNHRRAETKRTETGPRWENHGEGDPPHVARSRRKWKRRAARAERRTGGASNGGFHGGRRMNATDLLGGSREQQEENVQAERALGERVAQERP